MIINDFNEISKINFKCILIGAGPANLTIAHKLNQKGVKTLILEAGKNIYDEKSQEFYKAETLGDTYSDLMYARLRQFGGSSNHWGGTCRKMDDEDFDEWPIKITELNKYLSETSQILEIENKFEKNYINNFINQIQYQQSNVNFATKFFNEIKNSKNIFLCLESCVTDLYFRENSIYQIQINKIYNFKTSCNFIILGCGGVENSRLLLFLKRNNKKIFKNKLIGKYFMDHPYYSVGQAIYDKNKMKELMIQNYYKNYTNQHIFKINNQYLKKKGLLNSAIFLNPIQLKNNFKNNLKQILCLTDKPNFLRNMIYKNMICGDVIQISLEQPPSKNNKIELLKSTDSFGIPKCRLVWKKPENTFESIKISLDILGNFFIKNDLGRVAIFNTILEKSSIEHLGGYHHMGGTIIGENDNSGVVDKNLRSFDVKNLYFTGSSVFKSSSYVNPTFTIVQLSLRLSDKIIKDLA